MEEIKQDTEQKPTLESLEQNLNHVYNLIHDIVGKQNHNLLAEYKKQVVEKEQILGELLGLESKERKLSEIMTAIESAEMTNIFKEKDAETGKAKFSNEMMRKTELNKRVENNPDYQNAKEGLDSLHYKKKELTNRQSVNRSWRKYYELALLSEQK